MEPHCGGAALRELAARELAEETGCGCGR
ncbi:hypothetical protein ACFXJJ_38670 [Streptomyces sp. NPDC059233]